MSVWIAPSLLSADFSQLGEEVRNCEAAGADLIHYDVMDGRFVSNITMGPGILEAIRRHTRLALDVHLMIEEPERYVGAFVDAGADCISVHVESGPHLHRVVHRIRDAGVQVGVAINPATPIEMLGEIVADVDRVLVMTINPGFGGQDLIPSTIDKIARLRRMLDERGLSTPIEVDGGINEKTAGSVTAAGASILVAGSAVFQALDRADAIRRLRYAADVG